MPIYEYKCDVCGFQFEQRRHFDESAMSVCPRCQGRASCVLHSVPIIYKGSGFYTTDSSRISKPTSTGSKKKADAAEETKEAKEAKGELED